MNPGGGRSGSAGGLLFCQNKPERAPVGGKKQKKSNAEGNVGWSEARPGAEGAGEEIRFPFFLSWRAPGLGEAGKFVKERFGGFEK